MILAGPNGAGKSTAAPELLQGELSVSEFVNADVIARGLSAFDPDRAAIAAGRVMLVRLNELARQRATFAFETTLASRSFAPWLRGLRTSGYAVHLVFLWLSSPDLAVQRVADRVRSGGHDVPPGTIRRRYGAGVRNVAAHRGRSGVVAGHGLRWGRLGGCPATGNGMMAEVQNDVDRILTENRRVVGRALDRGIRKAILRHKKDGELVVVERNGKIELVKPEDLGY